MSKESAYLELRFRSPDETTRSSTWLFVNQLGNYEHFVPFQREREGLILSKFDIWKTLSS